MSNKKFYIILALIFVAAIFPLVVTPIVSNKVNVQDATIKQELSGEAYGYIRGYFLVDSNSKEFIISDYEESGDFSVGDKIQVHGLRKTARLKIVGKDVPDMSDFVQNEQHYYATDQPNVFKKELSDYYVSDMKKASSIYWPKEKYIISKLYLQAPVYLAASPLAIFCFECSRGEATSGLIGIPILLFFMVIFFVILFKGKEKLTKIIILILAFLVVGQLLRASAMYYDNYKKAQEYIKHEKTMADYKKYGCSGGNRWDEEIQACSGFYTYKKIPKEVLTVIVEHLGWGGDVSIISAKALDCNNCFLVKLRKHSTNDFESIEYNDGEMIRGPVELVDCWEVDDHYGCYKKYPYVLSVDMPIKNSQDAEYHAVQFSEGFWNFYDSHIDIGVIKRDVDLYTAEGKKYWKVIFYVESNPELSYEVHILRDGRGTIEKEGESAKILERDAKDYNVYYLENWDINISTSKDYKARGSFVQQGILKYFFCKDGCIAIQKTDKDLEGYSSFLSANNPSGAISKKLIIVDGVATTKISIRSDMGVNDEYVYYSKDGQNYVIVGENYIVDFDKTVTALQFDIDGDREDVVNVETYASFENNLFTYKENDDLNYSFELPDSWRIEKGASSRNIMLLSGEQVTAMFSCPMVEIGYEFWEFKKKKKEQNGYSVELWDGTAIGESNANDRLLIYINFENFEKSCQITSIGGIPVQTRKAFEDIYNFVK